MRTFVKSLKRLFDNGKITEDYLRGLLESGKISVEELEEILEQ